MKSRKHRWGDPVHFPLAHKTERDCANGCGTTKVTRHETEGGRGVHWTEFWRGGEQIHGEGTPACEPVLAEAR
jgi:hypothetical protein